LGGIKIYYYSHKCIKRLHSDAMIRRYYLEWKKNTFYLEKFILRITTARNITKDNEWLWVLVRTNSVPSIALPLTQSPSKSFSPTLFDFRNDMQEA